MAAVAEWREERPEEYIEAKRMIVCKSGTGFVPDAKTNLRPGKTNRE